MKKRSLVLAAGVCTLIMAGALAGCSNKESGVTELEILLSDDTLEGGAMAHMVEKFNEEFKDQGIQAKVNEVAYADLKTQIQNRAAVGELPALVKISELAQYVDYVHPLDESSLSKEEFLLNGTINGTFYAPTVNTTAVGMLINKTAFDEAGVAYPTSEEERWTWDEFEAAVKEVVEKSDKVNTGFVLDHSQQRLNTVLYQFGMQYYDQEDPDKLMFRSDATKKGLNFILDMYKEDGISKASVGVGTENAQDVFKTGTVAAHIGGSWVMSDYAENIKDFEWCPILMPYDTNKATSLGGNYLYAMEGTGQEKEAQMFLEWFFEDDNYTEYCSIGNYLPGKKGIEPEYSIDGMDIFNAEINASIEQPFYDTSVNSQYHSGESWGNALRDAMDRAIAGEMDSDGIIDYVIEEQKANYTGVHE